MPSTSIGTELYNDENEMEKPEVDNVEEENLLFCNNQTLMKLKKIKLLSPQRNIKMINMANQSPQQKNIDTVDKVKKSRKKVNEEVNESITSTKNKIDTFKKQINHTKKQRNHKNPNKHLIPPKMIKMTQLTKQINLVIFH